MVRLVLPDAGALAMTAFDWCPVCNRSCEDLATHECPKRKTVAARTDISKMTDAELEAFADARVKETAAKEISRSRSIPIADIKVPDERARALGDIAELAKSISEVGLLQPVVVTKHNVLVAGLHRLRACESLGWTEIPVIVLEVEGLRAELAEIDENLIRSELTVLERSEHLAKRKRIFEFLHPETKAKSTERQRARAKGEPDEIISPGFSEDTASKTGMSQRTVQQEVQIAEKITDEAKEAIRGTDVADSKVKLLSIARMPAQDQVKAVKTSVATRRTRRENWSVPRSITPMAKFLVSRLAHTDVKRLVKEIVKLAPYAKDAA
jgi:ParB family chromosome partitioning protein